MNMSQNGHSYVIFLNILKIYEVNIIQIYIYTKYVPIYPTVVVWIWCSVIMVINPYSAKCVKCPLVLILMEPVGNAYQCICCQF